MSRFEAVLQKYRDHTERAPSDLVESEVLARIDHSGGAERALIAANIFPPTAMAVGLIFGLAVSMAPVSPSVSPTLPELAVFAPDAPHLPSTWLE